MDEIRALSHLLCCLLRISCSTAMSRSRPCSASCARVSQRACVPPKCDRALFIGVLNGECPPSLRGRTDRGALECARLEHRPIFLFADGVAPRAVNSVKCSGPADSASPEHSSSDPSRSLPESGDLAECTKYSACALFLPSKTSSSVVKCGDSTSNSGERNTRGVTLRVSPKNNLRSSLLSPSTNVRRASLDGDGPSALRTICFARLGLSAELMLPRLAEPCWLGECETRTLPRLARCLADPPAAGMSETAFDTICLRGDCDTSAAKGMRNVACISAGSREWVAFSLSASISRTAPEM